MNLRSRTSGSKTSGTKPSSRLEPLDQLARRRLDRHDLHRRLLLLEVAPDAHERAARAEAGDEDVDLGAVAPDLRARCPRSARAGWRGCRTGTGTHERRVVGAELLRHADRAVAALVGGRQHDLGAEDLEQLAALDRHVLRHHDAQPVAAAAGDHREADARVARRRLEDRVARRAARRRPRRARPSSARCGPSTSRRGSGPRAWRRSGRGVRATAAWTPTSGVLPIRPRMSS